MDVAKYIEKGLDAYNIQYDKDILADLSFYIEELDRWNRHINLTGIKDVHSMIKILLYDAFFIFSRLKESKSILDMGSGNGILSITIAILKKPQGRMKVFSVDKSIKKIQFQKHIRRKLRLDDFVPIHGRIEMQRPMEVDALLAKGFGETAYILECGGAHIRRGGLAFIVKGKSETPQHIEGFCLKDDKMYTLPENDRVYRLFVYRKL